MKFQGKNSAGNIMDCGKDKDRNCPAYPDSGRLCWPVAGTKCRDGARETHARILSDCKACEFFRAVVFDGTSEASG